jgi:lipopolysaccharide transport system ATP-binding protein
MNNDIAISTKNLSKVYKLYKSPKDRLKEALHPKRKKYHKDFYALKNINLEIKKGEVIGIVGKNGSGKSTLLKILSRVLTPTSGEYMVKGKVSSLLELGSGFNPELTGIENIFFYATILGITEQKIKNKLQEILDFADIGDFIYQPLKTYSSGMRARLAFSVAINVDPDILILDEVLAVGDELFRRKCYARMEGFFKGQKTILFVSHNVSDINRLCTSAILLDRNEQILSGPVKLITNQYEKLLYCKPSDKEKVRNEIILINQDKFLKNATFLELNIKKNSEVKSTKVSTSIMNGTIKNQLESSILASEIYNPGFISKSREVNKYYDVIIDSVYIKTLDGRVVNNIHMGKEYMFTYMASFDCDMNNVIFGLVVKSEKGLKLSGSNSSYFNDKELNIRRGESYLFNLHFTCNLVPGNYYVNANVFSNHLGDAKVLSQVVDAYAFKVIQPEKQYCHGIMSLNQKIFISRIQ